ncbi:MAG: super-infection exclusion protein B, partial [Terriglobales bacterium]
LVMLIIEALILALIIAEFVWKIVDWWKARTVKKQYEAEVDGLLSRLDEQEASALQELVLNETPLAPQIYNRIRGKSGRLLVRDALVGLNVNPDHREYIRQWATGRPQRLNPNHTTKESMT